MQTFNQGAKKQHSILGLLILPSFCKSSSAFFYLVLYAAIIEMLNINITQWAMTMTTT